MAQAGRQPTVPAGLANRKTIPLERGVDDRAARRDRLDDPPGWSARAPARQTGPVLLKEIRAIAGETLVLSPHDQDAEHANTSWFGAPPHERMGMSADEVVTAFEETAELLRDQLAALRHDGLATFYVWHDQHAGQLRCSTGSCGCSASWRSAGPGGQDQLPFEEPYRATSDLHAIVVEFLEDPALGAIALRELEPTPFPEAPEPAVAELAVWVCALRP